MAVILNHVLKQLDLLIQAGKPVEEDDFNIQAIYVALPEATPSPFGTATLHLAALGGQMRSAPRNDNLSKNHFPKYKLHKCYPHEKWIRISQHKKQKNRDG